MKALMNIDLKEWKAEIPDIENHFKLFGNRLPERLRKQLEEMRKRLGYESAFCRTLPSQGGVFNVFLCNSGSLGI